MTSRHNIDQLTAHLFRENSGKMVAVLSRMFGLEQLDTVMDVVQDTFETALQTWRFSGVPGNPSGWLMQVAKNKALNTFKRENKTRALSPSPYLDRFETGVENQFNILLSENEIRDSQLRLFFACCHPGFSQKNQIILTLNILCGFGVPEISNALLLKEEAVKKALTRTKAGLKQLDNILETRLITRSAARTGTVQTILYLMFNEGYKGTRRKEAINNDLCFEAIRLARLLEHDNDELSYGTEALLALMFFNLSRFPARLNPEGEWLTLEEQDRSKWNQIFIEEGYRYLNRATQANTLTKFHLEAIIASLHCAAPTFEATDWKKIAWLYRQLEKIEPDSPFLTLNKIIAESYLPDPTNALQDLEEIGTDPALKNSFLLPAAKADIYRRKGDSLEAQKAYEQALTLAISPIDKSFLQRKIQQCRLN